MSAAPKQSVAERPTAGNNRAARLAELKTTRQRLRQVFRVFAYGAFSSWMLGIMFTIVSKGITLPGERVTFGSPWGLGLILLGVAFAVGAAVVKARLNRAVEETRSYGAEKLQS